MTWRDLLEKDDRTSPEDYPDMALITQEEFNENFRAGFDAAIKMLRDDVSHWRIEPGKYDEAADYLEANRPKDTQ